MDKKEGSPLSIQKTQIVCLTERRKLRRRMSFCLEGEWIRPTNQIKYYEFGLIRAGNLRYTCSKYRRKIERLINSLKGLMANLEGSSSYKKRLIASVVDLTILYAVGTTF